MIARRLYGAENPQGYRTSALRMLEGKRTSFLVRGTSTNPAVCHRRRNGRNVVPREIEAW